MQLPRADLILAREVLGHLPLADGLRAIAHFEASGARWLVTTYFPPDGVVNTDIAAGRWYPIKLQDEPFNFPPPLMSAPEGEPPGSRYASKRLGLWALPINRTRALGDGPMGLPLARRRRLRGGRQRP